MLIVLVLVRQTCKMGSLSTLNKKRLWGLQDLRELGSVRSQKSLL